MSTAQITFTTDQLSFLGKWFNQQRTAYTNAVMEDDFPADEEAFQGLCDATYNVSGFRVGEMVGRDVGDMPAGGAKKIVKGPKVKKVKDPDAPKRAKSSYMNWLWSDDGMDKVKVENPELTHKQAMSKAAEVWKAMDDGAKESWVVMSDGQKALYVEAMKEYVAPGGDKVVEKVVVEKKVVEKKVVEKVVDEAVVEQEVPDGVGEARVNRYLKGVVSKKRYGTLKDAVQGMEGLEGVGGVVYDGKSYTIRKSGEAIECSQPNILWVKN